MDMKKPFNYLLHCLIIIIVTLKSDQLLSMNYSPPLHRQGMHVYNFSVDVITGRHGKPNKDLFDNAMAHIKGVHRAEAEAFSKSLPILAILSGGLALALAGMYLWEAYDNKKSVNAIEKGETQHVPSNSN